MGSPLGNAVQFFKDFGLFDVVLPFLLVFSVVYALLEKSRVLGVEKIGGTDHPRRNLNAIVAFVVGLLVVATNKIVTAINLALPNVVLLLVAIVMFLMLIGTFYKTGEFEFATQHSWAIKGFMGLIFIGIVLIFANSIMVDSTRSWLDVAFTYLTENFSSTIVTSAIFLIVALGAVYYIINGGKDTEPPAAAGGGDHH